MKYILLTLVLISSKVFSQNPMPVPPLVSGPSIDLHFQNGTTQFFEGIETTTLGYNGSYLGPTIELTKGEDITLNVYNDADDTTTVHWHGLHVAAVNDGGPHAPIVPGDSWTAAFTVMDDAATYLYHPHPHMKTNQQFTLGAAGFIIVRDAEEAALNLPRTYGVDDFPIVIQAKCFDEEKQLVWDMETTSDNDVVTNGVRNAVLELPAQVVRLRLMNGSNERNLNLGLDNEMDFYQVAGDNSLLNNKVMLSRVMLASAERAEILLDLSGMEGQAFHLMSYGSEIPLGVSGGPMPAGMAMLPSILDEVDFNVLEIHVAEPTADAVTALPEDPLNDLVPYSVSDVDEVRDLIMTGGMMGQPFTFNGVPFNMDVINYYIPEGHIEKWNLANMSMMAHPFHLHSTHFYVVSRDDVPPPVNERGKKDVVLIYPLENVEIIAQFNDFPDPLTPYMYHCHILPHEDMGMMGQFVITEADNVAETEAGSAVIYPNPSSVGQTLRIDSPGMEVGSWIRMYDTAGKLVLEDRVSQWPYEMGAPLQSGMYQVVITGNHAIALGKIICAD